MAEIELPIFDGMATAEEFVEAAGPAGGGVVRSAGQFHILTAASVLENHVPTLRIGAIAAAIGQPMADFEGLGDVASIRLAAGVAHVSVHGALVGMFAPVLAYSVCSNHHVWPIDFAGEPCPDACGSTLRPA